MLGHLGGRGPDVRMLCVGNAALAYPAVVQIRRGKGVGPNAA